MLIELERYLSREPESPDVVCQIWEVEYTDECAIDGVWMRVGSTVYAIALKDALTQLGCTYAELQLECEAKRELIVLEGAA